MKVAKFARTSYVVRYRLLRNRFTPPFNAAIIEYMMKWVFPVPGMPATITSIILPAPEQSVVARCPSGTSSSSPAGDTVICSGTREYDEHPRYYGTPANDLSTPHR